MRDPRRLAAASGGQSPPRDATAGLRSVGAPLCHRRVLESSYNEVGGVEYLKRQAEKNPVAFMALLGKDPAATGQRT
jgi:hypothetical protein